MSYFENKNVLVTGAASGIGLLMARKALERGARHLVMWDINEDTLFSAATELSQDGYSISTAIVDISNKEQVEEAAKTVLEETGPVDVLFNNAGVITGKPFHEHSFDEIQWTMGVNTLGAMYVARAFVPAMIGQDSGHIVNIASAAALTPNPGMTVYAGSKWGTLGWSESLRIELSRISKNLKVLSVQPSYIKTGMFDGVSAPLLVPLLEPEFISNKILDAVESGKIHLREPFMVKVTPFLRGILPSRIFDFVAGKIFKVYDSMNTFKGRSEPNKEP